MLKPHSTLLAVVLVLIGCSRSDRRESAALPNLPDDSASAADAACSASDLTLADGFCASVFADSVGHARHMAVSPNGTVYVNTWSGVYYGNDKPPAGGFIVALRDTTGDGRADVVARFGDSVGSGGAGGTGIALYRDALYFEAKDKILRYPLKEGSITPTGRAEVVVGPAAHRRSSAAQLHH